MLGVRFLLKVLLIGDVLLMAGCPTTEADRPDDPSAEGSSTTTTEENRDECVGKCWESHPALFEEVSMFWIGPPDDAPDPPCPDFAPHAGSIVYTDLEAPHACPTCSCSPAECVLPEGIFVSPATCAENENGSLTWTSPAWMGECTADGAIPQGIMCNGEPCTQSLTIEAPTVAPCQPFASGDEIKPAPTWGLMARECKIAPLTRIGCKNGEACIPPLPDGYTLCIHRDGHDRAFQCAEPYLRRMEVFADYQDERSCAPCDCSAPDAAECAATVSVFTDSACSTQLAASTVPLGDPGCIDLPFWGAPLGSKKAGWLQNAPGSCMPSGGLSGAASGIGPITLCCLPEPEPVP